MPSGHAPLPSDDGPKTSRSCRFPRSSTRSRVMPPPGRLHHVQELFAGVEPNLVGEVKPVRDDAEGAVLVAGDVAVGEIGAQRVHPVLDAGRYRDPDAVA